MKSSRFILPLFFATTSIYSPSPAQSQTNLPARLISLGAGKQILLPDWQRISFSKMPPIQKSGSIDANGLSRRWNAGDTPDKYLNLGDIDEALKPQLFSLGNLNSSENKDHNLTKFPLLGKQSLQNLVKILPGLGDKNAAQIKPIASLIESKSPQTNLNISLSNLLSQNPELGKLQLNQINLSSYTIADIPNLDAVQLYKFAGWQNTLIKDIPGLNTLPLASFPRPLTADGNKVARIDAIWGTAEKRRQRTVSGSDVAGFSVSCSGQKCSYIELDDLENVGRTRRGKFEGSSWISGKYQQVEGGWGCLKSVNAGKEPTGRLPYGSAFKIVVMEPSEKTDTVDTALYFRFKNTCGATPYFIGPIPFFNYQVNSPIFLGN